MQSIIYILQENIASVQKALHMPKCLKSKPCLGDEIAENFLCVCVFLCISGSFYFYFYNRQEIFWLQK